jgi:FixJ family two-component response regulator
MAHSLQMKVLAEGVENEGQLALLVSGGCDAMQGHCFSPALEAEGVTELWRARPVFESPCLQRSTARQRTVLLVDDEENILASLRRLLRRDGYRILTATSAAEGLLQLAGNEVDVIVSDQRMPHMTGVEFLRRAKQLYPDTVRIVLSGYTELESITAAINEGAIYKFLTKPWEDQLLRANIDEAFRQKAMADDNRRLTRQLHAANEELAGLNERLTEALAAEHERTQLVETGLGSAVDMLLKLPAALLGIDEFGCISFVNREAEALWPSRPPLLGQDATSALPAALVPLLEWSEEGARILRLEGDPYHCRIRVLRDGPSCGRLLLITPLAPIQEPGS